MRDLPDCQKVVVNISSSGDNSVVAAITAGKTNVHGMRLSAAGAVNVTVKRGSTTLEVINFLGNGDKVNYALRLAPYYATAQNEALILNLSGAVQVNGVLEITQA